MDNECSECRRELTGEAVFVTKRIETRLCRRCYENRITLYTIIGKADALLDTKMVLCGDRYAPPHREPAYRIDENGYTLY